MVAMRLHPGDADWWWQYGLDGLVGGIIGGAATGFAVWVTLRAQRKDARADLFDRECMRLSEEARSLRDRLMRGDPDFIMDSFNWGVDMRMVVSATRGSEPCFASLVEAAWLYASTHSSGGVTGEGRLQVADKQQAVAGFSSSAVLLQRRVFEPEYFRDMSVETCERTRALLSKGAFL